MYYPDEIIEEVRLRTNIVDLISEYVSLKRKGNNYVGLCPFHNDHNPSFSVSERKQMYKCFSCGEGGNAFSFLMKYESMTFPEALQTLAARAGVSLPQQEDSPAQKKRMQTRERVMELNKQAGNFFYKELHSPHGERGLEYLHGRQLTDETILKFGLGYSGKDSSQVIEYLRGQGFTDEEIRLSGLASFNEKDGLSGLFWNRVMFPIQDAAGHVIAFGGRVMGDAKPKYLNSPETDFFNKRRNMYGYHLARRSRADHFILCEGYMDVIAMHQAGFDEAVASLGTAFTVEQANLLRRHTDRNRIYLAYDSDGPGVTAALRAIEICREAGLSCKVINLSPQKDPDEFIKANGSEAFRERIANAENGFLFQVRKLYESSDQTDPDSRTRFQEEVMKLLLKVPEGLARNNYLQAVCERYQINPDALQKELRVREGTAPEKSPYERPQSTRAKREPENTAARDQKLLLTWLTEEPELFGPISAYLQPEDYTEGLNARLADVVYTALKDGTYNPASIMNSFSEEELPEVAGVIGADLSELLESPEKSKILQDLVFKVKEHSVAVYAASEDPSIEHMQEALRKRQQLEELRRKKLF